MVRRRFTDDEIVVLAYLGKYNCNDLGYTSRAEIYRRMDEIFGRGMWSHKYKHDNILNEYHRAGIPKENKIEGASGVAPNSKKERWTERPRWEKYLLFGKEEWANRAKAILGRNPGVGRLLPNIPLPQGLEPDGESLITRSNSPKGWLYVLSHPSFKGWIKIGKTRNLSARLSSYNTGTPNTNNHYKFEYYFPRGDDPHYNAEGVERIIHSELRSIQNDGDTREWYRMTVEQAIDVINQHLD
jgi:hypothetical protein